MKTIIEMAREAGFAINELHCSPPIITFVGQEGVIEAFASLVAAAEREACAKIAYGQLLNTNALLTAPMQSSAAYQIGVSIRARGNT
jgi:hypothetical protein